MEETPGPISSEANPTPKNSKNTLLLVEGMLIIFLVLFSGFLAYQNQLLVKPSASLPEPTAEKDSDGSWEERDFGPFSYQYPKGWHVAELWDEKLVAGKILIAIDPKPISTAPRGGPLATFEIVVKSGLKNPDAEFKKEMEDFKKTADELEDFKEEKIASDLGPIYYYRGVVKSDYLQGATIQKYFLTFETGSNDLINQQVLSATLISDDSEPTELFRKIILSIKKD